MRDRLSIYRLRFDRRRLSRRLQGSRFERRLRLQHGQQRSRRDVRLGQVDGRQPQVGSDSAWRGMLRFVQFIRLVIGVIVVEFFQQFLGLVVIERQFVRLQQRVV
ncbi:MAG: hypothetical protein KDB14_23395 [Planctomycetales bacterium]|nr:hypothetical protein [Planctomycetales bacterium]